MEDVDRKALLIFAVAMFVYQKKLNTDCQCPDCTISEPAPSIVIGSAIKKHFNADEIEMLQNFAANPWEIENAEND